MSEKINSKNDLKESKKNGFEVVILGNYDIQEKIFSKAFPILLKNSNIKHKYLNRYDLSIRERINFPKDFLDIFHPELLDNFHNIDILILIYNKKNIISLEYLKTFYYLYFTKLEEKDKPKQLIILERDYALKEKTNEKKEVNPFDVEQLKNLYNAYFCNYNDDEEKLTQILSNCLNNILEINNYIEDYTTFKFKELNKEINIYILIYGDKMSQNSFIDLLIKSKSNFIYKKIKDNFYELKYGKMIDNNNVSFKIILKLVNNEYYYDSECNILLYDINSIESYNSIRNLIRGLIVTNGVKFKKIYKLFPLNNSSKHISENENNNKIKEGKNLAYEIGADFSIINTNNNNNLEEEIKNKFDNILDQIVNFINLSKINSDKDEMVKKSSTLLNENKDELNNFEVVDIINPTNFIRDINYKIKNDLNNNKYCLLNICNKCYSHLNIRINEPSNIIIIYCDKCRHEPIGLSIEKFLEFIKQNNIDFHCKLCKNLLNYDFKEQKLSCGCQSELVEHPRNRSHTSKNNTDFTLIPIFLKDCFCEEHNYFYQYYLKYSKKGLCYSCSNEIKENNFFVEKFINENINELIKKKNEELNKEKELISKLQLKFNECIQSLQLKFGKLIENKIKKHIIKSDLIKTLQIIHNNATLISNVKSLKFDLGEKFRFTDSDSIENKLNYIFNYFNYDADINNLYFDKNNNLNCNIHMKGPYNNYVQSGEISEVTDIWGLKNNEFICVSFSDGQAKVFDTKRIDTNDYNYKCTTINEFSPNEGINSLFVSNNENNIWLKNNSNKNEILYLNGYEEIKIIQMNDDYTSYKKLYTIKDDSNNIFNCIELDNNILFLNSSNGLKLITFNIDENNEIKYKIKNVNNLIVNKDKAISSMNKIKDNIISLNLSNERIELSLKERLSRITLGGNENENDILNNFTIKDLDLTINDLDKESHKGNGQFSKNNEGENEERFTKIISIKFKNNENTTKKENFDFGDNNLEIIKEYTFNKNYELVGCLSEENNLLLLNHFDNNKRNSKVYFLSIFDYNIDQFIYSFKINNNLTCPKLLKILNFNAIKDKQGFIIIDKCLDITQYFYEEGYINKIYCVHIIKADENKKTQISGMISLIKKNEYLIK